MRFHLKELVRAMYELVRSWWRVDRIRSSPAEGRLLRLQPPAFLVIDGRTIEVTRRVIGHDRDGPFVCYDCWDGNVPAQMLVRPSDHIKPSVRWLQEDGEQELDELEVSVYSTRFK